jgi:hypothetical protein
MGSPGGVLRAAAASGMAQAAAPEPGFAPTAQGPVVLAPVMEAEPVLAAARVEAAPRQAAPVGGAGGGGGLRNLFRHVTGASSGLIRRTLPEPAQPAQAAARVEPPLPQPLAARPGPRDPHQDEMGLDVPTFLRRQSN